MRNPTPFLPGISPQLCGRARRSQRDELGEKIDRLRRQSLSRLCELFGPWLPQDLLKPTAKGSNSRQRAFPVSLTFWAFLSQVLDPGSACREVVRRVQAWYAQNQADIPDSGSSAYCQARQRLPLETLQGAHPQLADKLAASPTDSGVWNGHRIQVIDGTGVSMPDTAKNRQAYSQPSGQKPGCGFPVMKIVGVFCLQTGALVRFGSRPAPGARVSAVHETHRVFQARRYRAGR